MKRIATLLLILLSLCAFRAGAQGWDISKEYPSALLIDTLPSALDNTSSLFFWQGELWTVNDHGGLLMYSLDTLTAAILRQLPAADTLPPFSDMEETAQDDHYFYFGDFGNNHEYLRDDLRVLRLSKSDLLSGICRFDTIFFTYEGYSADQEGRKDLPTTDFDCEAMIAAADSLYLFTKQWSSLQTVCYSLPKVPGSHTAHARDTLDVYGLVTGACYRPQQRLLVFSCYTPFCQPYVFLLYGFQGTDFFGGEQVRLPLANDIGLQTEAIATNDGLHYYLPNERLSLLGITYPAQLLQLDLTDYLGPYLHPDTSQVGIASTAHHGRRFSLSPNPSTDHVEVAPLQSCDFPACLTVYNSLGQPMLEQQLYPSSDPFRLSLNGFARGSYIFLITAADGHVERHTVLVR